MRKRIIPPVVLVLVVIGLGAYFFISKRANDLDRIDLTGHVEATEVDLSFRLAGHVARIPVSEGSLVGTGDLLAELRQSVYQARRDQAAAKVDEIEAYRASLMTAIQTREGVITSGVEQAKAGVLAAQARYKSLTTGSREQEVRAAEAALELAQVEHDKRQADYERMKRLAERQIISRSDFEAVEAAYEVSRAALTAAREQYELVKLGPREEAVEEGRAYLSGSTASLGAARASLGEVDKLKMDLKVVQAQKAQAEALLAMAEDDLNETRILAPFAGFITVRAVEPGEFIQPGAPVLTLVKLDRVWVNTYVPETKLGRVKLGQAAEVRTDSFPDKVYPGRVTYISPEAEFTPKNVQTKEERVKLVYRIKVSLDNPDQELKPGMPVDIALR